MTELLRSLIEAELSLLGVPPRAPQAPAAAATPAAERPGFRSEHYRQAAG